MNAQVHWKKLKARDIFHLIMFGFLDFIVQEQRNLQSFSMIHVGAEFFLEPENDVTVNIRNFTGGQLGVQFLVFF